MKKLTKRQKKLGKKQKTYYDLKARAAKLQVSDRILVNILAHDGKHKLSDKWAEAVFIV